MRTVTGLREVEAPLTGEGPQKWHGPVVTAAGWKIPAGLGNTGADQPGHLHRQADTYEGGAAL